MLNRLPHDHATAVRRSRGAVAWVVAGALVCSMLGACAMAAVSGDDAGKNDAGNKPDSGGGGPDATGDVGNPIKDAQTNDSPSSNCPSPFSGSLATWNFAGAAGSQASTASTSAATGITAGAVSRSAGIMATAGANSINSSNWATTAQADTTKYYTFTLTPVSGCVIDVSSIGIDALSSGTGPTSASIGTSNNAFASPTAFTPTGTPGNVSMAVSGASGALEIRVYGFAASAAGGTMRLQDVLTVTGSLH